ncbi:MAG: hypothetical protein IJO55_08465 [Lachnospiraceae bacterium]|nr:hypothetical protein [Lachnospiraceae bacterium]
MEFRKKVIKKDQYDETIQFLEKQLKKCFEEMVGLCNQYRRYYKDLPDEILQKLLDSDERFEAFLDDLLGEEPVRRLGEIEMEFLRKHPILQKYPSLPKDLSDYHSIKSDFYWYSSRLQLYEWARQHDPELAYELTRELY